MTDVLAGLDAPIQERRLVTEVPGPRSRELTARRAAAVSSAVGSVLPVFVERAGGGVVVDVDGNSLIDLGSGIAVVSVGNAAPAVVAAVQQQVAAFTHTCFMVTPYEGYVAVCEELARLTPGDHAKKSALFNSGAEAVENAVKVARHATGRSAVVVFDHAYHGRTNLTMALTAKNMPYKHGFGPFAAGGLPRADVLPVPRRARADRRAGRRPGDRDHRDAGRGGQRRRRAHRADPGRGRLRRPGRGLPARHRRLVPRRPARCSSPTRSRPASAGPATGSPARPRAWSPTWSPPPRASPAGCRWPALTGRAELMDAVHTGGLGGTYGGNPVACAAALATIRDDARAGPRRAPPAPSRRPCCRGCGPCRSGTGVIGDVRGRGAMLAVELVRPGTTEPDAELTGRIARACHAQGVVVLTAGTFGNVLRFLPPLVIGQDLLDRGARRPRRRVRRRGPRPLTVSRPRASPRASRRR